MSDDGPFIYGVPEGRVLDQTGGGYAEGVFGNISSSRVPRRSASRQHAST